MGSHDSFGVYVIYKALCFDVAQGRMNGAPNETVLEFIVTAYAHLPELVSLYINSLPCFLAHCIFPYTNRINLLLTF